jgi:hypothetical protein
MVMDELTGRDRRKKRKFTIYDDSQTAIAWCQSHWPTRATRHIDVKWHFIRTAIEDQTLSMQYVSTKVMLADVFTKALVQDKFNVFRAQLGVAPRDVFLSGPVACRAYMGWK